MPNIFLIGMAGVGKSWWMRQISQQYSIKGIDLDEVIEAKSRLTIPEYFENYGEDKFRAFETKQLHEVVECNSTEFVLACGGGTPCFFDNISYIKNNGIVIYLKASVSYIIKNLTTGLQSRPIIAQATDLEENINQLLHFREVYYEQAHYKIDIEQDNIKDIIERIIF